MAAAKDEMPCCKEGGPGHVCPLPAKKPLPVGTPVMESCCDVEQQILAALLGFAGIPEASEYCAGSATVGPERSPAV